MASPAKYFSAIMHENGSITRNPDVNFFGGSAISNFGYFSWHPNVEYQVSFCQMAVSFNTFVRHQKHQILVEIVTLLAKRILCSSQDTISPTFRTNFSKWPLFRFLLKFSELRGLDWIFHYFLQQIREFSGNSGKTGQFRPVRAGILAGKSKGAQNVVY